MQFNENFRQALQDYILLLDKKYPEKALHEMVSTRYALNHFERSMLFRGITTKEKAEKRKARLITIDQLNNRTLHIDLFNVLFTIAAYLRGFPVYLSNDGLLRDASESHGSGDWEVHLDKSLDLLVETLPGLQVGKIFYYVDNPIEYGGEICEKLFRITNNSKPDSEIIVAESPDSLIIDAKAGIIATSDSLIIDRSPLPVVDIALAAISSRFQPKIMVLENLI
jgi:hypothetical protein